MSNPRFLIHNNSSIMAAVDVETTGDRAGFHDIIQICVLPLDSQYKPILDPIPFYTDLKPKRPENCAPEMIETSRAKICNAQIHGIDSDIAIDLFDSWFMRLGLKENKRIMPVAHNWPHDRAFLIDWLGHLGFERYFDARYRDVQVAALYQNDRADMRAESVPYSKLKLQWLATKLNVERDRAHDALQDCLVTAEVYRRLLKEGIY